MKCIPQTLADVPWGQTLHTLGLEPQYQATDDLTLVKTAGTEWRFAFTCSGLFSHGEAASVSPRTADFHVLVEPSLTSVLKSQETCIWAGHYPSEKAAMEDSEHTMSTWKAEWVRIQLCLKAQGCTCPMLGGGGGAPVPIPTEECYKSWSMSGSTAPILLPRCLPDVTGVSFMKHEHGKPIFKTEELKQLFGLPPFFKPQSILDSIPAFL